MRSSFVLVFLVSLVTGAVARASTKEDFAKAVILHGKAYEAARNKLRGREVDPSFIKDKLESKVPEERLTAQMVQGWREQNELYEAKLTTGIRLDQKGVKRFSWSYDREEFKPSLLPLMYEFLLKDTEGPGGREAAVRIISYLGWRETKPDVRALTGVSQHERWLTEPSRTAVAQTLSALPDNIVPENDLVKLLQHETERKTWSKNVAGSLLNGMIRRGSKLPSEKKDRLVSQLLGSDSIAKRVGFTKVMHTIGAIGGQRAAEEVAAYLERASDPAERRWALSTLGSIGSPSAAKVLLKIVGKEGESSPMRIVAIESLGKCKYSNAIGDALQSIVLEKRADLVFRLEALNSLGALYRANDTTDSKTAVLILSRIKRIEAAVGEQPDLKEKISKMLDKC